MSLFTALDYSILHSIVFRDDYPGHRPNVKEKHPLSGQTDSDKRYAHVTQEYLCAMPTEHLPVRGVLESYFDLGLEAARQIARQLGVLTNNPMYPSPRTSCLRVLEYPAGAGSATHTDQSLLTVNLYRSLPDQLVTISDQALEVCGVPEYHIGEIGELAGLGGARKHYVAGLCDEVQHAIVFFALPARDSRLPSPTVGEWLDKRMAAARTY